MKKSEGTLNLVVPGLLGPMPGADQLPPFPGRSLLENALGRADTGLFGGRELEHLLFECFRLSPTGSDELPYAALRRLADGFAADDRIWFQVEPIALRPDQDRLLVFDMVDFDLGGEEATRLIAAFNDHFADRGLVLEPGSTLRWYLGLDEMPGILTTPLGEAFGRNMDMFLPRGEESLFWHRLLNEVQMLFHQLDFNREREIRGDVPVGGLWVSGGGALPTVPPLFDLVIGDDRLALGLARAAGAATRPLEASESVGDLDGEEVLLVDDRLQRAVWCADPARWFEQMEWFAGQFEVYVEALRSGRFKRIRLYPADGQVYLLTSGSMRRFWRRRRSLIEMISTP